MNMEMNVIQNKIYEIRGVRVMLDFDLAELYQVETKRLKEAVRRNWKRFEGDDFMFEVTESEYNSLIISLRSQIASSNERGGRRHMPFAFTEQGVAMLASVLIGILVAIALALIYEFFSYDELRRTLGIRVKLCGVDLRLVSFRSRTDNEAFVPARLMWRDLTEISCGAFDNAEGAKIELLHIPSTVKRIEKGALTGCTALKEILFECDDISTIEIDEDLSAYGVKLSVPYPEKLKKESFKSKAESTDAIEEKEFDGELYELPTEEESKPSSDDVKKET